MGDHLSNSSPSPWLPVALLLTAILATGYAAWRLAEPLFEREQAFQSSVEGIAFAVPTPIGSPGITLSASIRVDECDAWAKVEVVGEQPLEFWRAFPGEPKTPVAIAVLGARVRNIRLGIPELWDPLLNSPLSFSSEPQIRPKELRPLPAHSLGDGAATGAVIANWADNRVPLKAEFEARWVSGAGYHECTLHIPPVIGGDVDDVYGAGDGYLSASVPGYERRLGREGFGFASLGRVDVVSDFIDRGASSPPPRVTADGAYFICEEPNRPPSGPRPEAVRPLANVRTRSIREIRLAHSENVCSATVALHDSVRERNFNLSLILIGILISTAVALIIELFKVTARRPRDAVAPTYANGDGERRRRAPSWFRRSRK